MILEDHPPDSANAEQDQASDTTTTATAATALRRHLTGSPDRETARPLIESRAWHATEEPP
jgi:hypothetical protein